MENILKIIYDKSISNEILSFKDIDKILELLVIEKNLNEYIIGINVQQVRSNNLASYSNYTKKITIYKEMIDVLIKDIKSNILNSNYFEITLYINFLILQIILHEVEHANQQRIAYKDNTLEALILRMSYLIDNRYSDKLYEYCPEERLAEIKSFEEINSLINYINESLITLQNLLKAEILKRQLRGYRYKNNSINVPLVDYFYYGNKIELLDGINLTKNIINNYALYERFKYGFPISIDEYFVSSKQLVLSLQKNFNNKINIIKE